MLSSVLFPIQVVYHLLLTSPYSVSGGCPSNGNWSISSSGTCYTILKFNQYVGSVIEASKQCKAVGGSLASLRTYDDFQLAGTLLRNAKGTRIAYFAYVAGNDILEENKFKWLDGTNLQRNFWKLGEPNNVFGEDCAVLEGKTIFGISYKEKLTDVDCCKLPYLVYFVLCELDVHSSISDEIFYRKCSPELFTMSPTVRTTTSTKHSLSTLTKSAVSYIRTTPGHTAAGLLTDTTASGANLHVLNTGNGTTKSTTSYMNDTIKTSYSTNTTMLATSGRLENIRRSRSLPIFLTGRCCTKRRDNPNLDFGTVIRDMRVARRNVSSYRRTKVSVSDERQSVRSIGIASVTLICLFGLLICVSDFQRIWVDIRSAIIRQPA